MGIKEFIDKIDKSESVSSAATSGILVGAFFFSLFVSFFHIGLDQLIHRSEFISSPSKFVLRLNAMIDDHFGTDMFYTNISSKVKISEEETTEKNIEKHRKEYLAYADYENKLDFTLKITGFFYIYVFLCCLTSLLPMSAWPLRFRYKIFFYNLAVYIIMFSFLHEYFHSWDEPKTMAGKIISFFALSPGLVLYPFGGTMSKGIECLVLSAYTTFFYQWLFSKIFSGLTKIKYLPCPHCKKKLLMKANWRCEHCGDTQKWGMKTYFTSLHWFKCWSFQKEIECPNCGEWIKL